MKIKTYTLSEINKEFLPKCMEFILASDFEKWLKEKKKLLNVLCQQYRIDKNGKYIWCKNYDKRGKKECFYCRTLRIHLRN